MHLEEKITKKPRPTGCINKERKKKLRYYVFGLPTKKLLNILKVFKCISRRWKFGRKTFVPIHTTGLGWGGGGMVNLFLKA
jgi:hypothetical protein